MRKPKCCDEMEDFFDNIKKGIKAGIHIEHKHICILGYDRYGYIVDWYIQYCPFCGEELH